MFASAVADLIEGLFLSSILALAFIYIFRPPKG